MPSMVLTLAEKTFFSKVIGIDGNTPIFLKVLTIDGIDGLMGTIKKNSLLQTVRIVLQPIYINLSADPIIIQLVVD